MGGCDTEGYVGEVGGGGVCCADGSEVGDNDYEVEEKGYYTGRREKYRRPDFRFFEPRPSDEHMSCAVANYDFVVTSVDEAFQCIGHCDEGVDSKGEGEDSKDEL